MCDHPLVHRAHKRAKHQPHERSIAPAAVSLADVEATVTRLTLLSLLISGGPGAHRAGSLATSSTTCSSSRASTSRGLSAGVDEGLVGEAEHVVNLLTNALVQAPTSSPVAIDVRVREDRVEVTIRDGGPGMQPEAQTKAFDRFYRADPGRSRDHGGSGLGLAIVKSLTEAHLGTVTCASDIARGTIFTVHLPLA